MGWISLNASLLRAPLCGANNNQKSILFPKLEPVIFSKKLQSKAASSLGKPRNAKRKNSLFQLNPSHLDRRPDSAQWSKNAKTSKTAKSEYNKNIKRLPRTRIWLEAKIISSFRSARMTNTKTKTNTTKVPKMMYQCIPCVAHTKTKTNCIKTPTCAIFF